MNGREVRTLAEGFAAHGAEPRNTRWSWAAWSDPFDRLVATVWRDRWVADRKAFVMGARPDLQGGRERAKLLSRAKVGDAARVVYCIAVDERASPREIRECRADDRRFVIVELDDDGGFTVQPDLSLGRVELLGRDRPPLPSVSTRRRRRAVRATGPTGMPGGMRAGSRPAVRFSRSARRVLSYL